jgi:hypothetical protein
MHLKTMLYQDQVLYRESLAATRESKQVMLGVRES